MKGKVDILANFPIDTSLKKKTHSAMVVMVAGAAAMMIAVMEMVINGNNGNNGIGNGDNGSEMK